jgi:hypothetical protein
MRCQVKKTWKFIRSQYATSWWQAVLIWLEVVWSRK